jgi:hypothetical protein
MESNMVDDLFGLGPEPSISHAYECVSVSEAGGEFETVKQCHWCGQRSPWEKPCITLEEMERRVIAESTLNRKLEGEASEMRRRNGVEEEACELCGVPHHYSSCRDY